MSINHSARFQQIWRKKIVARWYHSDGGLTAEGEAVEKILPREAWGEFGAVFEALKMRTRTGKYIQNCFEPGTADLTTTGRRMKRFLTSNGNSLGVGGRPLMDFLLVTSDNDLKQRFGRKFLNVRKETRPWTGYNLFIKEHGFDAHRMWSGLDPSEKQRYKDMATNMAESKNVPEATETSESSMRRRVNTWTMAIQEWNRQRNNNKDFSPIKVGTTAYLEIKEIQARIKSNLST
jgi:hypothetical protein